MDCASHTLPAHSYCPRLYYPEALLENLDTSSEIGLSQRVIFIAGPEVSLSIGPDFEQLDPENQKRQFHIKRVFKLHHIPYRPIATALGSTTLKLYWKIWLPLVRLGCPSA